MIRNPLSRRQFPDFPIIPQNQFLTVIGQHRKRNSLAKVIFAANRRGKPAFVHVAGVPFIAAPQANSLRVEWIRRHSTVRITGRVTRRIFGRGAACKANSVTVCGFPAVVITANILWDASGEERGEAGGFHGERLKDYSRKVKRKARERSGFACSEFRALFLITAVHFRFQVRSCRLNLREQINAAGLAESAGEVCRRFV